MDRRAFLRLALGGAAAAAIDPVSRLLTASAAEDQNASAPRPNIIVILSDDMGYSDIGCYGGEINTPNLDRLAAGGVRFSQFYNTARCCPTRACLLTGVYPHQAAVGHMVDNKGLDGYQGDLSKNCVTIAEVLKSAGYSTCATGKWHVTRNMNPDGPKDSWPLQRGFDRYYGTLQGAGSYYDPGTLMRDNTPISAFADPEYKPTKFYYTDAISDHATRFVDDHHRATPNRPFFMYVAYTAAHWPMHALEEDIAKYKGKYDGGYEPIRRARFERLRKMGLIHPEWQLSPQEGDWDAVKNKAWEARCMEVYAAMIDRMDQGIGRLVETLRKNAQLENTLILFMQDNGGCQEAMGRSGDQKREANPTLPKIAADAIRGDVRPKQTRAGYPMLGSPNIMPGPEDTFISYGMGWANTSNTPFREYKHFVHEGGISTPLIAHWPAGISRRGELEHQPGHLIDIMTTCVALSGASYPTMNKDRPILPMEGRSLVPAFAAKPISREAIFWEHEGNRALRVGNWKLVAKYPAGKWELYDMENDRTELHDLADAQPQRAQEMARQWEAWAKRTKALPWPWKPQYGKAVAFKAVFDLKDGDDLASEDAPQIAGRPITITATVTATGDGVIVAHGGTRIGYSLYVRDGKLEFAVRRNNKMFSVASPDAFPRKQTEVVAKLARGGAMTLEIDGKPAAKGKAPGLIGNMPVDDLQVGKDLAGAVGEYKGPNPFAGTIKSVRIELGD